ncbi:MAG: oligosaccharide flippase family protein [Hylemonella sp.]|nr:oligosaccharide flippase family protein [Hylemonella sp.]
MNPGRNLLAGLANSVWSALLGFAVVPFYLSYLGMEAYGLIGFYMTMQAMLQLLDMGLAPAINREVARSSAGGDLRSVAGLLHTLAVVYWCVAGLIALLVTLLSSWIAEHWLQSSQLSSQTVAGAVMLMGLVAACRWPLGLYQGALIGAQRVTVASSINMAMTTVSTLGALFVLAYAAPSIEAFFIWQAGVGLAHAFAMRLAAWRAVGRSGGLRFHPREIWAIWRFSAGMSGIAVTALVFTQLDKLVLSRTVGLEAFGHYMLATLVVSGLQVLIVPVFNVIYPRMTALVEAGEVTQLVDMYRTGTRMFALIVFPAAMLIAVFANDFVAVWTRSPEVATHVAPIVTLLVMGSALNAVMYFPYALQLAYGKTWIPLALNVALTCLMVPLVLSLAHNYGAVGGAVAWLIIEAVYVVVGPWLTHKFLLKRMATRWLIQDVGVPLGLTIVMGGGAHWFVQNAELPFFLEVLAVLLFVVPVIGAIVRMSPRLRHMAGSLFA